jgi:hypothetical protein
MKTLGDRIGELREQKDLSLREFAKKIGDLSAAFLSEGLVFGVFKPVLASLPGHC